jgi:hypothetical protein
VYTGRRVPTFWRTQAVCPEGKAVLQIAKKKFLKNVGTHLPYNMASCPRKM